MLEMSEMKVYHLGRSRDLKTKCVSVCKKRNEMLRLLLHYYVAKYYLQLATS